ncbi:MAG: chromate efflux transporter [Bdellovibrionota bacterium]
MEKAAELSLKNALAVFGEFFRLGCIAFGGPLAHTALFEEEFVRRRAWISEEQFLAALSLTQLIPGPNSTELAMQIGYARLRWTGYVLAGIGFILPAAFLVALLAALYQHFQNYGALDLWLWGTKPVVAAVIVVSIFRLAPKALKPLPVLVPAFLALAARHFGMPDWSVLMLAAGIWLLYLKRFKISGGLFILAALPYLLPHVNSGTEALGPFSLFRQMFLVGSLVFGSGYVLYSHFQSVFVEQLHWISSDTLAMAIAAGQITPGPLFTSATYVGQITLGPLGAFLATLGIFSPAFLGGAIALKLENRMRDYPAWKECLQAWVSICFLLLVQESLHLRALLLPNRLAVVIFLASLALLTRFRWNATLLIGLGIVIGRLFG